MKKILIFTLFAFFNLSAFCQQEFPFDVEILGWLKVHNIGENLELEKVLVVGDDGHIYYKYVTGSGGSADSALYSNRADSLGMLPAADFATRLWVNQQNFLSSFTESDPLWTADKASYALQSWVNAQNYLTSFSESDPLWLSEKSDYLTVASANNTFLKSYTETDPIWQSEKSLYASLSWVNTQNYLTSFSESDPVWLSEKSDYLTIASANSTFLKTFTEADPLWLADKPNYANKTYVDSVVTADVVVFTPDSINKIYSFSLSANDSIVFDSTEVTKAYIFNLSSTADNASENELIADFNFSLKRQSGVLTFKSIFGSRYSDTKANVRVREVNDKLYFIAYSDSNLLNFKIHLTNKLKL